MHPGEESTPPRDRQKDRASIIQLVILGVIASVIGVILGLLIDWFPTAGSTQAKPIDTLWDVLVIVSVPFFVLVTAVILYCVWKFRMRPGQELMDGAPIHGNTRLEVIWTIIPAVLILSLCTYAYFVLRDIEEAQAGEMRVNVVGQQFTWTFEYPQAGGRPVRSNELYVPEGKPVRFFVKSRDVLHDFWVPGWRMKIDAVPGVDTDIRVTPNRIGTYPVVCAELCGLGHSFMRQSARVVSQQDFDRWLQRQQQGGGTAGGGGSGGQGTAGSAGGSGSSATIDGKTLFTEGNGTATACGGCHKLSDAGTQGGTGPDLDEALAGASAEDIRRGIVDPEAEIAEGFGGNIMPGNYEQVLSREELDALVKYLDEVSK